MPQKKRFSAYQLAEALTIIGTNQLREWHFSIQPQPPSEVYVQNLARLKAHFDLSLSEAAKSLLIDAILLEAIDDFARLKVWKEAPLKTATLSGTVDYLVAPQGKVYHAPLLCVVAAKKDNFEQGLAQCLVEMYACREINQTESPGDNRDIFGIVTNAMTWRFYKFSAISEIHESPVYAETQLELILGALRSIFEQCEATL